MEKIRTYKTKKRRMECMCCCSRSKVEMEWRNANINIEAIENTIKNHICKHGGKNYVRD